MVSLASRGGLIRLSIEHSTKTNETYCLRAEKLSRILNKYALWYTIIRNPIQWLGHTIHLQPDSVNTAKNFKEVAGTLATIPNAKTADEDMSNEQIAWPFQLTIDMYYIFILYTCKCSKIQQLECPQHTVSVFYMEQMPTTCSGGVKRKLFNTWIILHEELLVNSLWSYLPSKYCCIFIFHKTSYFFQKDYSKSK